MSIELPTGFLDAERWDGLVALSKGALVHMIENGETPEFIGEPMTAEQAVSYLEEFLDRNKATLAEAGVDFLAGLARKIAVADGPDEPIEEFEARLGALTDEQLAVLNEAEADAVTALKADVIDRRRKLVADLLETGKTLLRGAIATGLNALMAEIGDDLRGFGAGLTGGNGAG